MEKILIFFHLRTTVRREEDECSWTSSRNTYTYLDFLSEDFPIIVRVSNEHTDAPEIAFGRKNLRGATLVRIRSFAKNRRASKHANAEISVY